MDKYKRHDVLVAIKNIYLEQDQKMVQEILDKYGSEPTEYERERVQLAILKVSKANIEKIIEYVDRAKHDYRDLLYWAEYTKENKKIVSPYDSLFKKHSRQLRVKEIPGNMKSE